MSETPFPIDDFIPPERRARNPLITPAGYARLKAVLQHPAAPIWNYEVGDRVRAEDLPYVERMREAVREARAPADGRPPDRILAWVEALRPRVWLFQRALPQGVDLRRDWAEIPTMHRGDVASRVHEVVPLDADLSRLIVYDTSGVTGHALQVPHHPRAMAENHPLMEYVLECFGARSLFSADETACINVGAQLSTVVFANVFAVWHQAGFAKVNLHDRVWSPEKARRFFKELAPVFLTGDPVGFAEMIKWEIDLKLQAMLSTAVTLSAGLKAELEKRFGCPVIDTYAATETGPVAFSSPDGEGLRLLPHDLYVEIVDPEGYPLPEGAHGEICITGGRNPYLPLLRYRTGDFARMFWSRPEFGGTARLFDLEAREAVSFTAEDGALISPVDIGRVIRQWAFVQHEFVQRANRSCEMRLRPAWGSAVDTDAMREALRELFGRTIEITVLVDERLSENRPGGKVVPFRSEME